MQGALEHVAASFASSLDSPTVHAYLERVRCGLQEFGLPPVHVFRSAALHEETGNAADAAAAADGDDAAPAPKKQKGNDQLSSAERAQQTGFMYSNYYF